MIVQLIGTKYVKICEAVWAKSHTQNTTPIRDGWTHWRTDMYPMSPVRGIRPAVDNKYFFNPISSKYKLTIL